MIRQFPLLVLLGLLAVTTPGCGSRNQVIRSDRPGGGGEVSEPQRIANEEPQAVRNWSTGDR